MFQKISDSIEIVIVISAADIEKNKKRADLGITYDEMCIRDRALAMGVQVATARLGTAAALGYSLPFAKAMGGVSASIGLGAALLLSLIHISV